MRPDRIISSIPREGDGEVKCPHIGECPVTGKNESNSQSVEDSNSHWIYPSPKMFWEAMHRKGTLPDHLQDPQNPQTQSELDWIVTIHNVVNEQCWQEVCKWEQFRVEGCRSKEGISESLTADSKVKLQRFLGRPDDLSPRAWFKSTILGYRKPFDRHDWFVKTEDGPPRRYVIDFYSGASTTPTTPNTTNASAAASFYLDLRPALDTFEAVKLRMKRFLCEKLKFNK